MKVTTLFLKYTCFGSNFTPTSGFSVLKMDEVSSRQVYYKNVVIFIRINAAMKVISTKMSLFPSVIGLTLS